MQSQQQEEITMMDFSCNQSSHQPELIKALCLNSNCQKIKNCTICFKCVLKDHKECLDKIIELQDIPIQVQKLRQLSSDIIILQEKINYEFKQLLSEIENELSPITKYQNSPNLTNLNELGLLLRNLKDSKIYQFIDQKKINIKQLLDKYSYQQMNQPETSENVKNWIAKSLLIFQQEQQNEIENKMDRAIKRIQIHVNSKRIYKQMPILYKMNQDTTIINQNDSLFVVRYTWMISEKNYEILQRLNKSDNKYLCKRRKVQKELITEVIDLKEYINIHNLMAGIKNMVIPAVSQTILVEIYSELNSINGFLKKFNLTDVESKNIWVPLETDTIELIITNIFDESKSYRSKTLKDTLSEFYLFLNEQQGLSIKSQGKNKIIFNTDKVVCGEKDYKQVGWQIYQSILVEAQINQICQNKNWQIINQQYFSQIARQLENWKKTLNQDYSKQYFQIMKKIFSNITTDHIVLFEIILQDEFVRDACQSFLILIQEQISKPIEKISENRDLNQLVNQLSKRYINEDLKISIEQELSEIMNEIEQELYD